MKFVKLRTSRRKGSEELVEIKNIDDLLQIHKDEALRQFDRELIIGQNKAWRNLYPIERRKLYEEADGWYIEIYDDWRE